MLNLVKKVEVTPLFCYNESGDIMKKLKRVLKENWLYIITILVTIFISTYSLPCYIEAPGRMIDTTERITIENEYSSKGTFNMTYVSQLRATPIFYLYALINSKWDIVKPEDNGGITQDEEIGLGKVLLKAGNKYAVKVAYEKAGLEVKVASKDAVVGFVYKDTKSDFEIGDIIKSANGVKIGSSEELSNLMATYKIGDKVTYEVISGTKKLTRTATLIDYEGKPKIGILSIDVIKYETNPKCEFDFKNNESGSSGGLINALTIYNKLIKEDITKGLTIAGTGAIYEDGSVGEIGGVKYKILGAAKSKAEIFLVPYGENYDEAVKVKRKYKLDIDIIPVKTFDEAVTALENYKIVDK